MTAPDAGITSRPPRSSRASPPSGSTRRPAPSGTTSTTPADSPTRSLNGLGITSRPARSMVARMPRGYHSLGREGDLKPLAGGMTASVRPGWKGSPSPAPLRHYGIGPISGGRGRWPRRPGRPCQPDTRGPPRPPPPRPPARRGRPRRARSGPARPLPDHARGRRARARFRSRHALRRARSRSRAPALPPAAAVLGRLLLLAARAARQRRADLAAVDRPSRPDHAQRRGGGPLRDRVAVAGGVRAGGGGLPHRRRRARRDRPPSRGAPAHRHRDRGREPDQRLDALVVYRFAVAAVVTGSFSLPRAGLEFVLTGLGGLAIGLIVGWLVAHIRRRLDDPPTEMAVSLLTAYAAYIPAEELGVSGVVAAVTVGVFLGWRAPRLVSSPSTRLQLYSVWEMLQFLLNAVLFVLVGLQLPGILEGLDRASTGELLVQAGIVSGVVVALRLVWVFAALYSPGGAQDCLCRGG